MYRLRAYQFTLTAGRRHLVIHLDTNLLHSYNHFRLPILLPVRKQTLRTTYTCIESETVPIQRHLSDLHGSVAGNSRPCNWL